MRTLLYEAAHATLTVVRIWSWLKAWAMNIARRRGRRSLCACRSPRRRDTRAHSPLPQHASPTDRLRTFSVSGAIDASTFRTPPPLQPISMRDGFAGRLAATFSGAAARSGSLSASGPISATGNSVTPDPPDDLCPHQAFAPSVNLLRRNIVPARQSRRRWSRSSQPRPNSPKLCPRPTKHCGARRPPEFQPAP